MKEVFKNWLLLFAIVTVSGIILYFALPSKQTDESKEVLGTTIDYKYAPYITSIPNISAIVGELFEYEIEISDLDTPVEEVQIYLEEKPMWLYLEDSLVTGVPNEEGTYRFVVTVSDGFNSTSQINYILVESNE